MTLTTTAALVTAAADRGTAVAAVNVITLEHAEAIAAGAERAGRPVIMQLSENAVRYHGGALAPITVAAAEVARAAGVPVALHLDHATDLDLVRAATDLPFSSAMFDAGSAPYAENVEQTARAVRLAHDAGLWLEAELGFVGGKPDAPRSAHADGVRTDPDEAVAFVDATGVDALAVAVGSAHAMTTRSAVLDDDLIRRLRTAVPVPLVLHGSSGVGDDTLRAAVAAGIAKVNVGTALNIAMTGAVREVLARDPDLVDPRRYLAPARDAMADAVADLLLTIG